MFGLKFAVSFSGPLNI